MNDRLEDISELVEEIKAIDGTMEGLKAQRQNLREQILLRLQSNSINSLQVKLDEDESYSVSKRVFSKVSYDQQELKERLDYEKFCSLLVLDNKKIKKEQSRVMYYLKPMLEDVGTISTKLVKEQIEVGNLKAEDFKGAFSKEDREFLYIRKMNSSRISDL
ncbi:MAG: hypothetical protein HN353_06670 [Bdellovibrionales bacterium]|nr:hypothetical protein [Bdellovibrionales bacterium]MBT3526430.1 hypothetical protein [Bdellovibrionales bacterium]MBT7669968.1 hypothetical protein [Bdellovibrionales bacterium]MBT7766411.1 hypothetical protein [Bdellovibrionales bacterium]